MLESHWLNDAFLQNCYPYIPAGWFLESFLFGCALVSLGRALSVGWGGGGKSCIFFAPSLHLLLTKWENLVGSFAPFVHLFLGGREKRKEKGESLASFSSK